MRICDLKQKEVINCKDGERLGYVCDIEFDICTGCLSCLIVPGPCKIWGIMGRDQEYIIPWNCIRQIGTDIILVEVNTDCILVKCE